MNEHLEPAWESSADTMWKLKHATFPTFLQNHLYAPDVPVDAHELELTLRRSVLYCRGLIVADSDLNNNKALHRVSQLHDSIFWPAIKSGFIRRAARLDEHGNRVRQRTIAATLLRTNPVFYDIRDEYLDKLEAAIEFAENHENSQLEPALWTPKDVSHASVLRLIGMLGERAQDESTELDVRNAFREVRSWVKEKLEATEPYSAAALQLEFANKFDVSVWNDVWKVVTDGHGGNIALLFRGRLPTTSTPATNDWFLPGGPESEGDEEAAETEMYGGQDLSPGTSISLEVQPSRIQVDENYDWNNERLAELTFEQLLELRECSEPAPMMELRFNAAASAAKYREFEGALIEAALDYHEKLYRSGGVLTNLATYASVREELLNRNTALEAVAVVQEDRGKMNEIGSHLVQATTLLPSLGRTQAMLDWYTLTKRLGKEAVAALLKTRKTLYITFKRPDYRVLERLAEQDM